MNSQLRFPALVCSVFVLASSAFAQLAIPPLPTPNSTPASAPTSSPSPLPQSTIPNVLPPADQSIPVVITYGDGTETRAQITRGLMPPVGVPPAQPVTVTLFLGSGIPGTVVHIGLYDGGQFAPASSLPSGDGGTPLESPLTAPILVLADQTVRFNFQSGLTFGLYRTLVTIGPKQYLLQFYAVKPRAVPNPIATPTAIPTPNPPPVN